MKNRILSLLLLAIFTFTFSSCAPIDISAVFGKSGKMEDKGEVRVVLAKDESHTEVYTASLEEVTSDAGLLSVLDALGISYVEKNGFLHEVGDLKEDPENSVYIALWTTVDEDSDPSGWIENRTFEDLTLSAALVGASEMKIRDGAVYYVGLMVYAW